MRRPSLTCALGVILLAGLAALAAAQQPSSLAANTSRLPEQFVGVLASLQGRGGSTYITMHVDSYSPDEEVSSLGALLKDKGQDEVVAAMFKMEKGWVKIGTTLGYGVAVIRTRPTEAGRRIVLVTDRPIQFFEARRGTRSLDYPFGIIELTLDARGRGTGKLIAAAQARFNADGTLEVTSLGTQPYEILQVRPEKAK